MNCADEELVETIVNFALKYPAQQLLVEHLVALLKNSIIKYNNHLNTEHLNTGFPYMFLTHLLKVRSIVNSLYRVHTGKVCLDHNS